MPARLIGLTGKAGSGKDYTYNRLASLFPNSERVAFADVLKFDIEEALGVTPYELSALRTKPYSTEVRALLQWWGTDLRRNQDEDFWVKASKRWVKEALDAHELVAVTDVRFANEAALIRDLGGIVIEVDADDAIRRERLGGVLPPAHASEDIDFEVDDFIGSWPGDILYAGVPLLRYLGLDATCSKCWRLLDHPTHDSGKPSGLPWVNLGTGATTAA